jgi:transcriptional regulator with XRE-family HTH domain
MAEKHLTEIEQYLIDKVREVRTTKKVSQMVLSQKIDMSDTFVGHVESKKKAAKYNVNHINAIAKALDCSVKDFFPDKPF